MKWKWPERSKGAAAAKRAAAEPANDTAGEKSLLVGKVDVLFGLQWVSTDSEHVKAELRTARKAGYSSYVANDDSSVLGLSRSRREKKDRRQKRIAAALLLADGFSSGGSEIFAIRFDDGYGVVALRDAQPVPGFDAVGDLESMQALVDSFMQMPHLSQVRRCGCDELLGIAEEIDWAALLARSDGGNRLLPIPDPSKYWLAAAFVATGAAAGSGWFYYQWQLEKAAEAQRRLREQNPDYVYEKGIAQAMASAGRGGQEVLDVMIGALKRFPLAVAGWTLAQVECDPSQCQAKWSRSYGNFADFEQSLPEPLSAKPDYVFMKPSLSAATVSTRHPVVVGGRDGASAGASAAVGRALQREQLPAMPLVATSFASRLQDYALAEVIVDADAPSLFGGSGDAAAISRPVVSGKWKINGPLWALDSLRLADYATVDKLVIEISWGKDNPVYRLNFALSGKYYAKGKDY